MRNIAGLMQELLVLDTADTQNMFITFSITLKSTMEED